MAVDETASMASVPVGIHMRVFNWIMWSARQRKGLTQAQLGELVDSYQAQIGQIEILQRWPSPELAADIAAALDSSAAKMFPARLAEKVKANTGLPTSYRFPVPIERLELSDPRVLLLEAPDDESDERVSAEELVGVMEKQISTLGKREQQVLRLRFGLGGTAPMTRDDVGHILGITGERVRQIEGDAKRELRRPSHSKVLRAFLSDERETGREMYYPDDDST